MISICTLSEIMHRFNKALDGMYPKEEIRNFCFLISEQLLNYSKIDFHLKREMPISAENEEKFNIAIRRLQHWEPVQYVTGHTEFMDLDFEVNSNVLIPRPETTELVAWILEDGGKNVHILDVGTGSGCIAVSLAAKMQDAIVSACDISEASIGIARRNALHNGVQIQFFRHDVLQNHHPLPGKYQVIVSNPPYITNQEKDQMRRNVLDHEPSMALFVPDSDPFRFYRQISLLGRKYLEDGGRIYFEINEKFPHEIRTLLENAGFFGVKIRNDLYGKPRMVKAYK